MTGVVGAGLSNPVADLNLVQTPELADLASRDRVAPRRASASEASDGRHLVLQAGAEQQPVAGADRSREHPDVGDLLAVAAAFDLEDTAADGPVSVACGG